MNDPMEPPSTEIQYSCLAVFDFDATLAKGDSLWPFLQKAVGKPRSYWSLACALLAYAAQPCSKDGRTIIKRVLLKHALKGKNLSSLKSAIESMHTWPEWMQTVEELKRHHKAGHKILIASGGLDIYIKSMLRDIPYHDILCTKMEVVDGVLTGNMVSGNCVRARKAELVKKYIESHGPFSESWGYGNAPHDIPMMEHLHRGVIVEKE